MYLSQDPFFCQLFVGGQTFIVYSYVLGDRKGKVSFRSVSGMGMVCMKSKILREDLIVCAGFFISSKTLSTTPTC